MVVEQLCGGHGDRTEQLEHAADGIEPANGVAGTVVGDERATGREAHADHGVADDVGVHGLGDRPAGRERGRDGAARLDPGDGREADR